MACQRLVRTAQIGGPKGSRRFAIDCVESARACSRTASSLAFSPAVISTAMRPTAAVPLCLVLASCFTGPAPQQSYDLLIAGGSVLNGEGTPAVQADVGIRGDRIAAIGDLRTAAATRRIDASGLTVAPGFIDIHNHSDYTILVEPKAESMI